MIKISYQQRIIALLLTFVSVFTWCEVGYAVPWVKIGISPQQTEIESDTVVFLTTEAGGTDLEFTWKLIGPGKIEGTGPAVAYNPPGILEKSSVQVHVTVIVRDNVGRESSDSVTFNVIPASPKHAQMSTSAKVILGVGAAAAVGGGIALAALNSKDESSDGSLPVFGNWSFSGQVLKDTCDFLLPDLPSTATEALNIEQDGFNLTASHQLGNVLQGNWHFTGRVSGNSFQLSSSSPGTGTSDIDCTYSMSAEIDVENIVNNSGNGNLRINVTGVSGCSGTCQAVWPGTWTRTAW